MHWALTYFEITSTRTTTLLLLTIVLAIGLSVGTAHGTEHEQRFQAATAKFESAQQLSQDTSADPLTVQQSFRSAAEDFANLWIAGAYSAEVATNAANSYYFAGKRGEAVLFYLRALSLDPDNAAATSALEHVRQEIGASQADSSASLVEALFFWHESLSFSTRKALVLALFPTAWILFIVELLRRRVPASRWLLVFVAPVALVALLYAYLFQPRRPYMTFGILCLIPTLLLLGSLVAEVTSADNLGRGVVVTEVQGRLGDGPAYSASHSRPFVTGTEIVVLEERGASSESWTHVRLTDGSTSWLPTTSVDKVFSR